MIRTEPELGRTPGGSSLKSVGWRSVTGRSGAVWFLVASFVSGLLSVGYLRLSGGQLDGDGVGALRAVLAAYTGFAFFATGLQVAFAAMLKGPSGWARRDLKLIASGVSLSAAVIAAIVGVIGLPDTGGRPAVVTLVAAYVLISGYASLPKATLLVRSRWSELGLSIAVAAVAKFFLGWLVRDGSTLTAALFVLLVAESIGTACVAAFARSERELGSVRSSNASIRPLAVSLVSLGGMWVLGALDSVVARLALPPLHADAYSASASVARIVYFVPATVSWLALPSFITGVYGSHRLRRTLFVSLVAVGGLSIAALVVVLAWLARLQELVTRDVAVLDPATTRWLALAWAMFAVSNLLVLFHVAQRSRLAFAPWVGAVLLAMGSTMVGDAAVDLARLLVGSAVATLVVLLVPALSRVRPVTRGIVVHDQPKPDGQLHVHGVAVVVPCYNPGEIVLDTIQRIAAALDPVVDSFEVIAVSDGSTDHSPELLDAIHEPWFRHIRYARNGGKGCALRRGFEAARAEVIGFIDADGDLDPEQLPAYLRALVDHRADAVLGSKRHPDSELVVPTVRRLYSWGYQRIVRLLFRLDVGDTQTGIKLFRGDLVRTVLPVLEEDGFAFDLELLIAARAHGLTRVVELPVHLEHQFNSTVSSRSALAMLSATLRMFWRCRLSLHYQRLADQPPPVASQR